MRQNKFKKGDIINNLIILNCVSCCEFCNKAKRNITIDEFYNKCYKIVNKKIELNEKYFNIAKERIEKISLEGCYEIG